MDGRPTPWHGPVPSPAAVRKVDFLSKGRTIGQVIVFLPLDRHLVERLSPRANLGDQQRLGLADGGRLLGKERTLPIQSGAVRVGRADIRAGGVDFRSDAERLVSTRSGAKLVALERSSRLSPMSPK